MLHSCFTVNNIFYSQRSLISGTCTEWYAPFLLSFLAREKYPFCCQNIIPSINKHIVRENVVWTKNILIYIRYNIKGLKCYSGTVIKNITPVMDAFLRQWYHISLFASYILHIASVNGKCNVTINKFQTVAE